MITISSSSTAIFTLPPAFDLCNHLAIEIGCSEDEDVAVSISGEELVATWSLNVKFFLHPPIFLMRFPMSCSEVTVLFLLE